MSHSGRSPPKRRAADAKQLLENGRACYAARAWARAYEALTAADRATPLEAPDLERLALSAYLIGRDDDYLAVLERAHREYVEINDPVHAARCAFWIGLRHLFRGETARASGWLARAQRLLERGPSDCVERGYLLLPPVEQLIGAKDMQAAFAMASKAIEIGERFNEADLVAIARHMQGRILLRRGEVERGLALLDETMLAVMAGELSPLVTGLIYCSVIDGCQEVYAVDRAREWTRALAQWCDEQPEMVSFTGRCLVHRAEILQLHGAWPEAIDEARRAGARCTGLADSQVAAVAFYQEAEVHRLRGEHNVAEEVYRKASGLGFEPQPGLALLRLAQGRSDAAAPMIRRVMHAAADPIQRARLLPSYIEIMLAAGDVAEARRACGEFEEIVKIFATSVFGTLAAQARGAVELAEGDAQAGLRSLRRAWQGWQQVEAPFDAARVRVLIGLACRALGDEDGCAMELDAARVVFEQLGAAPDLARVESLRSRGGVANPHGLTARELQVLRLIASGKTNKAIACALFLSEKTVDRHVSNIFVKLDVASRSAATAFAYEHKLV